MLQGFAPVIRPDTIILIMGSFPGEASLEAGQYYAHPRNQFWRLLGEVIAEPLHELSYAARLQCVLRHRIGIWDVLAACHREGSIDVAIRNAQPNDCAPSREHAPRLAKVCFNGKTAGRFAPVIAAAGYQTLVLPSSSPAYAMLSFEKKLALWRDILM